MNKLAEEIKYLKIHSLEQKILVELQKKVKNLAPPPRLTPSVTADTTGTESLVGEGFGAAAELGLEEVERK